MNALKTLKINVQDHVPSVSAEGEEIKTTSINITKNQLDYVKKNKIVLSHLVQDVISQLMKETK